MNNKSKKQIMNDLNSIKTFYCFYGPDYYINNRDKERIKQLSHHKAKVRRKK